MLRKVLKRLNLRGFKENMPPVTDHHYKDKSYKMSHTVYDLN